MTEYLRNGPFSVQMGGDAKYRANYDAINWGKKEHEPEPEFDNVLTENYAEGAELGSIEGRTTECELPGLESDFDEDLFNRALNTFPRLDLIPGTIQHDVREFHRVMGQPIATEPGVPSDERVRLRLRLIHEEYCELLAACGVSEPAGPDGDGIYSDILLAINECPVNVDLVEVADALADIAYVVEGANLEFGFDSETVLAEVQRSNMTKLDNDGNPVYNEEGKVTKGPNYSSPDIKKVLNL